MRALAKRPRLRAAFAAVMAVVLTATGLFVYKRQATNLDGAINRALRARATDIAALAQRSDTGLSDGRPSESPGAQVGLRQGIAQLKRIPGVSSVEPLQHRFAYIGADLQDLYGVRPQTITGQESSRTDGSPVAPPRG